MADDLPKEKATPNGGVAISNSVNLHLDDSTDTTQKYTLHYGVEDNPPIYMTFFFGLQVTKIICVCGNFWDEKLSLLYSDTLKVILNECVCL